jgi:hypothetical protein
LGGGGGDDEGTTVVLVCALGKHLMMTEDVASACGVDTTAPYPFFGVDAKRRSVALSMSDYWLASFVVDAWLYVWGQMTMGQTTPKHAK